MTQEENKKQESRVAMCGVMGYLIAVGVLLLMMVRAVLSTQ